MFGEIVSFEWRYQTRQPLFWIATLCFALLAFGGVTTDAVVIGGSLGNVHRNAPFVILQFLAVMSVVAVFVTTAFVAGCVQRDWELGTHELFFSRPIRRRDYLLGRFTGAMLVSTSLMCGVAIAIAVGGFAPWLEGARLGPFQLMPYVFGMLVIVVPNLLITGALFFAVATRTRTLLHTYAAVVALFVGWGISRKLLSNLDHRLLSALLDPFGLAAFGQATRFWTVAEKNTLIPPLEQHIVLNRLLWLAVAGLVLAFTCLRFRVVEARNRRRIVAEPEARVATPHELAVGGSPDHGSSLTQWLARSRLELVGILHGSAFLAIAIFGILNVIGGSFGDERLYGTPVWPVTHRMLSVIEDSFSFIVAIIIAFYSGELTWRERALGLGEVIDATPVKTWVLWSAKLTALVAATTLLLAVGGLTTVGIQLAHGYTRFELPLYGAGLGLMAVRLVLLVILAFMLHVLVNNKYLGFLLMLLFVISSDVLHAWGFDHLLYNYGSAGESLYSDMNGYGHFLRRMLWMDLYWLLAAVLLGLLCHLFWVRGTDPSRATRRQQARSRLTGQTLAVGLFGAIGMVATGSYIFYNTNVLNEYVPSKKMERRQAEFEKLYKQYEGVPQPRITDVWAAVDVFPAERRASIRGYYTVRNKTTQAMDTLHLTVTPRAHVDGMTIPTATVVKSDGVHGYTCYQLDPALAPGAELRVRFELSIRNDGFTNGETNTDIVENGTYLSSERYFPHIGYNRGNELQDPSVRRKHGLPGLLRMPKLEDEAGRGRNELTGESDWIGFETVVSTSPDQIAIAPGYLQREWREGERRYFHYRMDSAILGLFAYQSARYEVTRDRWNDVAIEIYHHPTHTYNVAHMIDAVKKSLDYLTKELSPYQHHQVRIVEFPRYKRFAQSLPNTIPFSESIGFIARLDDPEDIDYVLYVTAHEVAHQWWAHQLIGANVQGSAALSESLAQHAALMIMRREFGADRMRKFLKYELTRYLHARGDELIEELPLLRVESQPYIYYNKGSLVMYALADSLGEEALNTALRDFLQRFAYTPPPYPTSQDLLDAVRAVTPQEWRGTLSDLFETITLFDNRATRGTYERLADGTYLVRLELSSRKLQADAAGVEHEVPVDDWIEVGVFGAKVPGVRDGRLLSLDRHRLTESVTKVEVIVAEQPTRAGIDPLSKLIDRNPDDNITRLQAVAAR